MKKKKNLVITSLLARLTDFEVESKDNDFVDWCEELREELVYFGEEKSKKNNAYCEKCGCTELLCGHNKRS